MRHPILCAALALAAASAGAGASDIYQWTDARGITHYSETPPPAGTPYQTRRITNTGSSAQPAPAPGGDAGTNPQCAAARANIEILTSEGPVQQEDAEGNARELTADERARQLDLAQAAARAYCVDEA